MGSNSSGAAFARSATAIQSDILSQYLHKLVIALCDDFQRKLSQMSAEYILGEKCPRFQQNPSMPQPPDWRERWQCILKSQKLFTLLFRHHSETLLCKGHQKLPGQYNTTRIINWGTFPSRHILRVLARTALLSTQNMILWKSIYNR